MDVALLPWPGAESERDDLRAARRPRLLLLSGDTAPPPTDDVLEDWVRTPADPRDVQARMTTLRSRAMQAFAPQLDTAGRLQVGSHWVALSPIEQRLIALLIERFGSVVSRAAFDKSRLAIG